ncbi:MAG: hypothetical protein J0L81_07855 [Caulobacterales bacterium]|nr:hypothetical protein [Caulobacterales bacterium]
MSADPILARLLLAMATTLLLIGVIAAWTSTNLVKRVVGLLFAMLGALVGAAALAAPAALLMLGAGVALGYFLVAAALIVRVQEAYGAVEAAELDSADGVDEPAEPKA